MSRCLLDRCRECSELIEPNAVGEWVHARASRDGRCHDHAPRLVVTAADGSWLVGSMIESSARDPFAGLDVPFTDH